MVLSVLVLSARAQYDPVFSHYYDMEPSFNPAAVGKEAKLNVNMAYGIQMAGYERNPQSMYAAADLPFYFLKTYHGGGVQLVSDKIGLFNHTRLEGQYAYRFGLLGGQMGVGLQLGLISETFDGSKVDLGDSNDPAFSSSKLDGHQFDISAGLYYQRGPLYAGLSAQHINAPLVELGEKNELQIDRSFYFTGGYDIKLRNPFLTVKPSVLVRTDQKAYRADLTGRLVYTTDTKTMYAGLGYSPSNSVTLFVGGKVQGVMLGYSYEFFTNGIGMVNGSHELFIGYQTDINLTKKGKNRHQSVRIL